MNIKNVGEETDTTVTQETTPSSANITPSQSGDLNTSINTTTSEDNSSVDPCQITQSQHQINKDCSSLHSAINRYLG
jgi:hypothetical protein